MTPSAIALGFGIVLLAIVSYYVGYRSGHAAAIEAVVFVQRAVMGALKRNT